MVIDSEQEIMTRLPGNVANSNVCKLLGNVCESLVVLSVYVCLCVCVEERTKRVKLIEFLSVGVGEIKSIFMPIRTYFAISSPRFVICFDISAFYKLKIHASLFQFWHGIRVCVNLELNSLCLRSFKIGMIDFRCGSQRVRKWIEIGYEQVVWTVRSVVMLMHMPSSMCFNCGHTELMCVCAHEYWQLNRKLNEAKINWVKTSLYSNPTHTHT